MFVLKSNLLYIFKKYMLPIWPFLHQNQQQQQHTHSNIYNIVCLNCSLNIQGVVANKWLDIKLEVFFSRY